MPPTISDAEAQIMECLWAASPQTAEALAQELMPRTGWQLPTLKTLLNRLLNKGAVQAQRDGRRYLYSPCLSREAWLAEQGSGLVGLVDRLFGGQLAPLVAQFSAQRPLSAADKAALKRLLQEQGDD